MKPREKILAITVGVTIGLIALGVGARAVIVKPVRELDQRTAVLREKLDKLRTERRAAFQAEDQIKALAQRAFADTVDQASAKSGELLTHKILQAGLAESDFTRLPVGPRKLRGASEIGWSVQGEGPLTNVVNLLFILQESPYLCRTENLVVAAGGAIGTVRVRFRYLTLVIELAQEVQRSDLPARFTLESPERRLFNPLVARDILRPYIPRPPPPPPPILAHASASVAPGPEGFRIVSLSEWQGLPEVHVRDLRNLKTFRYKAGDELAGGKIVMVDYRPMPMPGNELLQSFSRVIVKNGTEYWAIERGKTLAEKRKLPFDQLPAELARAK